ncbi:MAG TPA: metalloregulator ArsR/SmtB family transcription factor [Nocardioidaceae bacterium]|nr:metalloregulator ArsR/SmtB family transcription factor [Nocardioidaceae bacterium]
MAESGGGAPVSFLRALAHPTRLQILSLLTGAQMSAAEIARELDITHANASYHLRVLARAGEVVEAGEEHIRGGVAKRYRHPWDREDDERPTDRADGGSQAMYIQAVADELVRRHAVRRERGKGYLTDAEMWVSPQVWDEVLAHAAEASRLIHKSARPPHSEGCIHVNLTQVAFEMGSGS